MFVCVSIVSMLSSFRRVLVPGLIAIVAPVLGSFVSDVFIESLGFAGANSIATSLVFQLCAMLASLSLYTHFFETDTVIHWGERWKQNVLYGLGLAIGLLAIAGVLSFLISLLGIDVAMNRVISQGENNPVLFLYLIPISIFLVGPSEEFLFRGLFQGVLRDFVSTRIAVVTASILFGFAHVNALGGLSVQSLPYIFSAFSLGCILGVVYEKRESLFVPAVAHGIYNATLFAGKYVSVAGVF